MAYTLVLQSVEGQYDFIIDFNVYELADEYLIVNLYEDNFTMKCYVGGKLRFDVDKNGCLLEYSDRGKLIHKYRDLDNDNILNTDRLAIMINHYVRRITSVISNDLFIVLTTAKTIMIEFIERLGVIAANHPLTQELLDELCGVVTVKSAAN